MGQQTAKHSVLLNQRCKVVMWYIQYMVLLQELLQNVLYSANILKLSIFKLSLQLRLKPQMAERLAHPTTHVRPRHDGRGSHPSLVTLIFRKLGLSRPIWRWVMWVYQWFSHHLGIPSGYWTVCHGKSPFLTGKPSIIKWAIFHGYVK